MKKNNNRYNTMQDESREIEDFNNNLFNFFSMKLNA